MAKKSEENFSPEQAQKRFEAALRGARVTGHKPMKSISPKVEPPEEKKPPKKRAKTANC